NSWRRCESGESAPLSFSVEVLSREEQVLCSWFGSPFGEAVKRWIEERPPFRKEMAISPKHHVLEQPGGTKMRRWDDRSHVHKRPPWIVQLSSDLPRIGPRAN